MELFFLGTASGLPTHSRFGQTILLAEDGLQSRDAQNIVILDPGDGASSLIARYGLTYISTSTWTRVALSSTIMTSNPIHLEPSKVIP